MQKILLVEDEAHVVSFINKGLTEIGYQVSVAFDGKNGFQLFSEGAFDLVILDIMLPEMNGLEVCKNIRSKNEKIPILFLTALGTSENVVLGLDAGADDYLVKPFKFIELAARIKSLLRRAGQTTRVSEQQDSHLLRIGDLTLNDDTKTLMHRDQPISLTTTEYRLIRYFMNNKNKVLSRVDILQHVWGVDFDLGTNVVDVYVNYLRKKIDKVADTKYIHTVIGMGYVLRNPQK